jgi:hypothetical protein
MRKGFGRCASRNPIAAMAYASGGHGTRFFGHFAHPNHTHFSLSEQALASIGPGGLHGAVSSLIASRDRPRYRIHVPSPLVQPRCQDCCPGRRGRAVSSGTAVGDWQGVEGPRPASLDGSTRHGAKPLVPSRASTATDAERPWDTRHHGSPPCGWWPWWFSSYSSYSLY